jgi:hypothetical protein
VLETAASPTAEPTGAAESEPLLLAGEAVSTDVEDRGPPLLGGLFRAANPRRYWDKIDEELPADPTRSERIRSHHIFLDELLRVDPDHFPAVVKRGPPLFQD